MAPDKRFQLVQRVLEQSRAGKVDWEETANSNEFIVTRGNLSILISEKWQNDNSLIVITILNDDGDVIESFNDEEWGSDGDVYELFRDLYNIARRYAMGTEQALDQLLAEFDDVPF